MLAVGSQIKVELEVFVRVGDAAAGPQRPVVTEQGLDSGLQVRMQRLDPIAHVVRSHRKVEDFIAQTCVVSGISRSTQCVSIAAFSLTPIKAATAREHYLEPGPKNLAATYITTHAANTTASS